MRFIGVARSSGWFVGRAVCSTWQLETAEFLGCIYFEESLLGGESRN